MLAYGLHDARLDQFRQICVISGFKGGDRRVFAEFSREARSAAKRTQFLFAAFASYIAVSAQAISCCGDEACFGKCRDSETRSQ